MQSHSNDDFLDIRNNFLSSLEEKANKLVSEGKSTLAAGESDDEILLEWKSNGVSVVKLPNDEHNMLRISIGGGDDTPVKLNYCTFRGNHSKCVDLLRKALIAMQSGPDE